MIKNFINYLKEIDVFEDRIEGFDTWDTEIFFNDLCFQIDFNFKMNKVVVLVWQNINDDEVQIDLPDDDLEKLVGYLETLEPDNECEVIPSYYDYYGVKPEYFI
ncbi:hypothetical protein K5I29_02240 [Flavobacterium agricola]|uniref:Immunity protein 22 of polymorphic toxin system n=1 Tax=Flavobacterium agricola TaxID=2870839 RepID=A0ABY6M293_9FLAO|nr:hypothetical protein [Flavobacterium agricola]UYW01764.1 hypothetical protein K5I29_02240 [Flavobacterium agricola]